ncbi:hypothetical protein CCHR01_11713 [Colletotrichum chrysophilum]|uniref:Uncharacterized protein n=1 Tax=Colletotrichum chrysophilum TaxID=1836956 RepID=A0AAD9ACI8_9PEZI|nr:hypothetical protein CCHR01_11713 [Colletotrichum chrysophilum]
MTLSFISSLIQKGPRALLHCILSLDRPLSPSGVQSGWPPVIALFAGSLAVMTNLMTAVLLSPNSGGSLLLLAEFHLSGDQFACLSITYLIQTTDAWAFDNPDWRHAYRRERIHELQCLTLDCKQHLISRTKGKMIWCMLEVL